MIRRICDWLQSKDSCKISYTTKQITHFEACSSLARLTQLAEYRFCKPNVIGSTPIVGLFYSHKNVFLTFLKGVNWLISGLSGQLAIGYKEGWLRLALFGVIVWVQAPLNFWFATARPSTMASKDCWGRNGLRLPGPVQRFYKNVEPQKEEMV